MLEKLNRFGKFENTGLTMKQLEVLNPTIEELRVMVEQKNSKRCSDNTAPLDYEQILKGLTDRVHTQGTSDAYVDVKVPERDRQAPKHYERAIASIPEWERVHDLLRGCTGCDILPTCFFVQHAAIMSKTFFDRCQLDTTKNQKLLTILREEPLND